MVFKVRTLVILLITQFSLVSFMIGEGNGNLLQYSYQKNSMDRRAWLVLVHGVAESHMTN